MIEIDGAKGEGGGQIVRSSLALSAITGKPFTILNVRAGRKKPGLKRQHVTCVKAAAEICDASVDGAILGSNHLTFFPSKLKSDEYHFKIGTAGSAPLVAQTVLPALMLAEGPSKIIVEGGTHNPMAPCYDYLERVYFPQVQKMGPQINANLKAYGFYPAGGGKIEITIAPVERLNGLELVGEFGKYSPKVTAIVSSLPAHIGEREVDTIRRKMGWSQKCTEVIEVKKPKGPGNAVLIELIGKNVTEIFFALGERGVRAEQVAKNALKETKRFLACNVPVGEHLADQLLLPMGLAAEHGATSQFKTVPLSDHSQTHKDLLKMFLDVSIESEETGESQVLVTVSPNEK